MTIEVTIPDSILHMNPNMQYIKNMKILKFHVCHWARRAKVQVKWSIATFRNSVHIGSILKRRGLKLLAAEIKMQAS